MRPTPPHIRRMIRSARPGGARPSETAQKWREMKFTARRTWRWVNQTLVRDLRHGAQRAWLWLGPAASQARARTLATGRRAWDRRATIGAGKREMIRGVKRGISREAGRGWTRLRAARPKVLGGVAATAIVLLLGLIVGLAFASTPATVTGQPTSDRPQTADPALARTDPAPTLKPRSATPRSANAASPTTVPASAKGSKNQDDALSDRLAAASITPAWGSGNTTFQSAGDPVDKPDPAEARAPAAEPVKDPPQPATPEAEAGSVVYLVDVSGSLVDSLPHALHWLDGAVRDLRPGRRFTVLFFRDGEVTEAPPVGMKTADDATKQAVRDWINPVRHHVEPGGHSSIQQALALAKDYDATELFILSDDTFSSRSDWGDGPGMIDRLAHALGERRMRINTVQFFYRGQAGTLQAIADRFGGTYQFIDAKPRSTTAWAVPDVIGY